MVRSYAYKLGYAAMAQALRHPERRAVVLDDPEKAARSGLSRPTPQDIREYVAGAQRALQEHEQEGQPS